MQWVPLLNRQIKIGLCDVYCNHFDILLLALLLLISGWRRGQADSSVPCARRASAERR